MAAYYCALQDKATTSVWCKRNEIIAQLNKFPYSTTNATSSERSSLLARLTTYTSGRSTSVALSQEIIAAKKAYCALSNADTAKGSFCNP